MYCNYKHNQTPKPKYFKESVENSFPSLEHRLNFLNKLYQCLLAGRFLHKVPKLVVCGEKDSGKTSWASIIRGIIPDKFVATVSKEGKFAISMINDATQLIFIDEWSQETMMSDTVKTLMQGILYKIMCHI